MAGEEDGFVYSRYGSPTCEMLQQRFALIENAETCRVAASGMGAISTAILAPLKAGDRVVAATALFGSCRWIIANQMPKFGIETVFVDGADLKAWEREIAKGCQLVLIESPANPLLDGVDIEAVAKLCKAAGALKANGAAKVVAYCTHPVLSGPAVDNINASELDELVVTDTIPLSEAASQCARIRQLTLSNLLAESIRRVSNEESISALFR